MICSPGGSFDLRCESGTYLSSILTKFCIIEAHSLGYTVMKTANYLSELNLMITGKTVGLD